MIPNNAPIVIGGTGGSGTRVFMRLIQSMEVDMGIILNESEDAISLTEFCDQWINVAYLGKDAALPPEKQLEMDQAFLSCLEQHCDHIDSEDLIWGWKYPRSIYLLPFIYKHFPNMRFIHVIRNGLDMAFSPNQNQLYKHGSAVLEKTIEPNNPQDSLALWSKVNNTAAEFGNTVLGRNYIRIKFEDLVNFPISTTDSLLKFLDFPQIKVTHLLNSVDIKTPSSIERWRQGNPSVLNEIIRHNKASLNKFGYPVSWKEQIKLKLNTYLYQS